MSKQVEIQILDTDNDIIGTLDLEDHETFPLAISKSASDIRDISKRRSGRSRRFNIPATKANNDLLSYLYNANIDDNDDLKGKKPAAILQNKVPIDRGRFQVTNVVEGIAPKEYVCVFYSDNSDWQDVSKDKKVVDFEYGFDAGAGLVSDLIFEDTNTVTGDPNNDITSAWIKTVGDGWDIQYPLIHYGQWGAGTSVSVLDLRPGIYIHSIFDKFFEGEGFTLISDHLDSTSDFQKKFQPFVGEFKQRESWKQERDFKAGLTADQAFTILSGTAPSAIDTTVAFDDDSTGDFFDGGGNYDTSTFKYTFDEYVKARFKAEFDVQVVVPVGGKVDVWLFFIKNGVVFQNFLLTPGGPVGGTSTFNATRVTPLFEFALGDEIEVAVRIVRGGPGFPYFDSLNKDIDVKVKKTKASGVLSNWFSDVQRTIIERQTYKISDVWDQDQTILDVVTDYNRLVNGYWRTDSYTKKAFFEPRDTFYKDISQAIDWSDKLDLEVNPNLEFVSDHKRELHFYYKDDDKDKPVEEINQSREIPLAGHRHNLSKRFKRGIKQAGPKQWAATWWIQDDEIVTDPDLPVFIPRMWKDNSSSPPQYSNDFEHRILHFEGFTTHNSNSQWRLFSPADGSTTLRSNFPLSYMADVIDGGGTSLYYGNDAVAGQGLFDKYWNKTIGIVETGLMLTAAFFLNDTDMQQLDLRLPVFIGGPPHLKGYYVINEIKDYQPLRTQSTKVELLKIIPISSLVVADQDVSPADVDAGGVGTVEAGGIGASFRMSPTEGESGEPSFILANKTGNKAASRQGSVAFGIGVLSPGRYQSIYGRWNVANTSDIYQVGSGDDADNRATAIRVDKNGVPKFGGGAVLVENTDNELLQVYVEIDNKFEQVTLSE